MDNFFDEYRLNNEIRENDTKTIPITLSKSGLPCAYESGGSYTHWGKAVCIGNKHAKAKKPLYVFKHGSLACENHAIIALMLGDIVMEALSDRGIAEVKVYRVVGIDTESKKATLQHIVGAAEWVPMMEAVSNKSCEYHCRTPYWVKVTE